ncbi:hypothetical protein CDO73_22620 [Saccharibacillus sp. O23]|uniref:hypothetical protein n=1 Tax=Saccharibacillus sp. O23 TaxID=2009338 RepID=UPI000B4E43E5|nr:hypothetical protein [Saccharibacillus sp. O23]OWR27414.1 hypothetical protein CDO73_22620 [Saccharibacillus sp. O23]
MTPESEKKRHTDRAANEEKRVLFFHEDDYAMLELIPTKRKEAIEAEMEQIRAFGDEHRTEGGYTDLYVRQSDPRELDGLRIQLAEIEEAVSSFAYPYDQVITGYGSSYRVECEGIRAFGPNEETVLLCEYEDGLIRKAWMLLDIGDRAQYDWASKLLLTLARIAPLMLADLTWGINVDLRDEEAVKRYLDEYLEEDEA